ncbi:MAG: hypothetical protein M0Z49_11650 [Chloroflexi bacterium]|nr:hypothetical protein [Chloroflexota bacterium]
MHVSRIRRLLPVGLAVVALVAAGCGGSSGSAAPASAAGSPDQISLAGSGLTDDQLAFCNQSVWANLATAAETTGIAITPLLEKISLEATPGAKSGLAALTNGNDPGTAAFGEIARHDPEYVRLCLEAVAESTQAP